MSLKFATSGRKRILSQNFLREKYVKEGLNVEQIATLANSSNSAVKSRLNKLGLVKTLMRRKERAEIKARNIAEIKRLRDSGLSMRKIASKLTVLGYPNLIGGTRWNPMMVRRLLKEISKTDTVDNRH